MSDPTKPHITITISGAQGIGKSRLAEVIQEALLEAGHPVTPDPQHGPFRPKGSHYQPRVCFTPVSVQIVEVVA